MADGRKKDDFAIELGDRRGDTFDAPPRSAAQPVTHISTSHQGLVSILSYCASSILMTTTNKYVLSGLDYNLNFLLLAVQVSGIAVMLCDFRADSVVQSIICVIAIQSCKSSGIITYRDFNLDEARKCMTRARHST
jgi:GDP-mannose transporter